MYTATSECEMCTLPAVRASLILPVTLAALLTTKRLLLWLAAVKAGVVFRRRLLPLKEVRAAILADAATSQKDSKGDQVAAILDYSLVFRTTSQIQLQVTMH